MSESQRGPSNRIAAVVAGVHRSGTSALAGSLAALGFSPPNTILEASDSNLKGHWESVSINRLNDKLLAAQGFSWRSWCDPGPAWDQIEQVDALRAEALATLEAEFGDAERLLLKDPRLCRLMPFWLPVLAAFGARPYVLCPVRNPVEVAASLDERNGFPPDAGLLLWLRYQLDLEFDTRGCDRAFISYPQLLDDWRGVVGRIHADSGLALPDVDDEATQRVAAFLTNDLRHHHSSDASVLQDPTIPDWIRSVFGICLQWSARGENPTDYATLDQVNGELNALPEQLRGVLRAGEASMLALHLEHKRVIARSKELSQAKQRHAADQGRVEALSQRLEEASAYRDRLQQNFDDTRAAFDSTSTWLRTRLDEVGQALDRERAAAQAHAGRDAAQRESLQHELLALRDELRCERDRHEQIQAETLRMLGGERSAMRDQLGWLSAQLERLQRELADARSELDRERGRRQTVRAEMQRVLNAERSAMRLQASQLSVHLESLKQELAAARSERDRERARQDVVRAEAAQELQRERQAMEEQAAQLSVQLDGLRRELRQVRSERDRARAKFEDVHAKRADVMRRRDTLEQHLGRLQRETAGVAKQLEATTASLRQAESERQKALGDRDVARRKVVRLQQLTDRLQAGFVYRLSRQLSGAITAVTGLQSAERRTESRRAQTVRASSLFDAQWYLRRYPDVARAQLDPALHYVRYGAEELRDPGPGFSTAAYLERYPDVSTKNVNALVHYENHGRAEKRKIEPAKSPKKVAKAAGEPAAKRAPKPAGKPAAKSVTESLPNARELPQSVERGGVAEQPESVWLDRPRSMHAWINQADLARLDDVIVLGGLPIGRVTGQAADAASAESVSAALAVFAGLSRVPVDQWPQLAPVGAGQAAPVCRFDPGSVAACDLQGMRNTPVSVAAIAFVNDRDLRLTVTLESSAMDAVRILRGYQYDASGGGELVCLGEHALQGLPITFVDLAMLNPFLPVLLILADAAGQLLGAAVLPFPSLFSGGAHEVEVFTRGLADDLDVAGFARRLLTRHLATRAANGTGAIRRICVDTRGALGDEALPGSDMRAWLTRGFAIDIEFLENGVAQDAVVPADNTLVCPAFAIPTLQALCAGVPGGAGQGGAAPLSCVAVHSDSARHWVVELPSADLVQDVIATAGRSIRLPQLAVLPGDADIQVAHERLPLALLEIDDPPSHLADLLMPVSADVQLNPPGGSKAIQAEAVIDVVITMPSSDHEAISILLESLVLQRDVALRNVLIAVDGPAVGAILASRVEGLLPGRIRMVECQPSVPHAQRMRRLVALLDPAPDDCLLFINRPLVLHDARTLGLLARLARRDDCGSAACMLVNTGIESRHLPPAQVAFSGVVAIRHPDSPQITFETPDVHALFPASVFAVASNGHALFAMRAAAWQETEGLDQITASEPQQACLELGAMLARRGLKNLMTTALAAELGVHPQALADRHPRLDELSARELAARSLSIEVLPA